MRDRRGFTLIELLIVVCIIGLLAGIAVPKLQAARGHARAAAIVGAMRAIRIAATIYYDSAAAWPASAARGVVPPRLVGYLPQGGTNLFTGTGWQLQWRTTTIVSGGTTTRQGTMRVRVTDPLLCTPLGTLLGGASSTVTINCGAANGTITQTIER